MPLEVKTKEEKKLRWATGAHSGPSSCPPLRARREVRVGARARAAPTCSCWPCRIQLSRRRTFFASRCPALRRAACCWPARQAKACPRSSGRRCCLCSSTGLRAAPRWCSTVPRATPWASSARPPAGAWSRCGSPRRASVPRARRAAWQASRRSASTTAVRSPSRASVWCTRAARRKGPARSSPGFSQAAWSGSSRSRCVAARVRAAALLRKAERLLTRSVPAASELTPAAPLYTHTHTHAHTCLAPRARARLLPLRRGPAGRAAAVACALLRGDADVGPGRA